MEPKDRICPLRCSYPVEPLPRSGWKAVRTSTVGRSQDIRPQNERVRNETAERTRTKARIVNLLPVPKP